MKRIAKFSHMLNIICIISKKTLQAHRKVAYLVLHKNSHPSKRMSSCFQIKASVTIEAAIAIPIFIFFTVNLIGLINTFQIYSYSLSKVQQSAKAISYLSNDDSESDLITFQEIVPISPIIGEISFLTTYTKAGMAYKRWNGFSNYSLGMDTEDEEYVYVTNNGYAYHKNRNCKHLKVSIEAISSQELTNKRNSAGRKYTACELCLANGTGMLFITKEGTKYHSSASCSGIKRNISIKKLSEVKGKVCCSECGQ